MHKQKGFGLFEVLIIIGLVLLLIGIGYYFFRNQHDSNQKSANSSNPTNPAPKQKTLTIKEWGIQIDKPRPTDELTYIMQQPDSDGAQRLHFSYKKLQQFGTDCNVDNTVDIYGLSGFGSLVRFIPESKIHLASTGQIMAVKDIEKDTTVSASLDRYKKVGNNYYYLAVGYGGSKCFDNPRAKAYLNSISSDYSMGFDNPAIQNSIKATSD